MSPPLREKIVAWADPVLFISVAVKHYIIVAWQTLWNNPSDLFSKPMHDKAFARFWIDVSPPAVAPADYPAIGAIANVPSLHAKADGVVLELGPGSGTHTRFFDTSKVKQIYAVEPGVDFHPALHKSAAIAGFALENYTVLACGAQADSLVPILQKQGIIDPVKGPVFDTIVSVRSLCTLTHAAEAVQCHYDLLRPGGKYIIFEHVANPWPRKGGSIVGKASQYVYSILGWSFFIGCSLRCDTVKMLQDAAAVDGGWGQVDITCEKEWATLPWAYGTFTKKSL